jgi:hypothetical protein
MYLSEKQHKHKYYIFLVAANSYYDVCTVVLFLFYKFLNILQNSPQPYLVVLFSNNIILESNNLHPPPLTYSSNYFTKAFSYLIFSNSISNLIITQ